MSSGQPRVCLKAYEKGKGLCRPEIRPLGQATDHELVADAVQMATWRRRLPKHQTVRADGRSMIRLPR